MPNIPILQYQQLAYVPLAPVNPSINEAPYHQPWSLPRWDGLSAAQRIALIASGAVFPVQQAGEIVTVDKWYQWLSEPIVKEKKSLGAGLQQFLAYSESAQFPEIITEAEYHQPWSLPVWSKIDPRLAIALDASGAFTPVLNTDQILQNYESPWHQPWSLPVWSKIDPRLAIALDASGPFTPVLDTNQVLQNYESPWHQPWSLPVWDKPRLATGLQTAAWLVKAPPFQETVMESKFHQPLSEPLIKQKIGLRTGDQQFLAFVGAKFGEPISYDKYAYAWSEPIWLDLRTSRLKTHLQMFGTNDPYWGIRQPKNQGYIIT